MTDSIQNQAIQKTSEAAQVVDKIAEHLGDAAGNLAAKFTTILEQYGPDAAILIREVGRVQAFSQVSYLLLGIIVFCVAFSIFTKRWKAFDAFLLAVKTEKSKSPQTYSSRHGDDDIGGSIMFQLALSGIAALVGAVMILAKFSLAAIYGLFSPEAFLVIKLLNW